MPLLIFHHTYTKVRGETLLITFITGILGNISQKNNNKIYHIQDCSPDYALIERNINK